MLMIGPVAQNKMMEAAYPLVYDIMKGLIIVDNNKDKNNNVDSSSIDLTTTTTTTTTNDDEIITNQVLLDKSDRIYAFFMQAKQPIHDKCAILLPTNDINITNSIIRY